MSVLTVAKSRLTGSSFGARLRCARELAGLSQHELAEAAGIHRVNLNRYETDKVKPAVDVAWKLADAVGVSLDELRGAKPETE
ncbi:helix-turn-helix transcriptional regulator [Gemmata sp. G18]|uniref:Helix-turn-helix transcriptional regulator n=1 Tax=Gemmata palustris TaxID=2822762 RepID=A0ABS5BP63_9BACT|nr:helix-turn-helix transcriptional regulator [Gemmata palustris]MBP3955487.1 helix-turn-helix transcriptional regulator [Gemmata palustris]